VMLPRVTVGSITLHNVPAIVVVGNYPANVLLGNSFLHRVEMQEQSGVMVLRSKL
jgi:aspartyl protease family protein